jgi:UDP-N-acetylglucosamine 4-epimerase
MFNKNLYTKPYHDNDLSNYSFLITGGAGFIGSNLVEYLLKYNARHVRVLDNLSNGYFDNLKEFTQLSNFEFINGDIRDLETCKNAVNDIDFVSHQAALGSVPRSIANPILTNDVNVGGFLNMLNAAKESKSLKRFVYAASSSTYGDSPLLPKVEGIEGKPLSPYAVTKLVNELYAQIYSDVYGFHTIGLRYFNVFGPKQSPDNAYAAVIPIFSKSILEDRSPTIFGDGQTSRDFTFIENVIQANIKGLLYSNLTKHEVFNTAAGVNYTLLDIVKIIEEILDKKVLIQYAESRQGDIKHSLASISKIKKMLDYHPKIDFKKGLGIYIEYLKSKN